MPMNNKYQSGVNTSWQHVSKWYRKLVNKEGHYYHQHTIIPGVLKLLNLRPDDSLLDLACGEGILGRAISKEIYYQGFDIASSLITLAKKYDKLLNHHYQIADITNLLPLSKYNFTKGAIILALQNIENPRNVILNFQKHLVGGGQLIIIINHPYFRIPRQTSWETDPNSKMQYRRVNRYLSPLKIPINQQPSEREKSPIIWSFHYPLSSYSQFLYETGFVIEKIEEWVSDKRSEGKAGKMENRARAEFPLFMAVLARKIKHL